jgi:hypothetical protein
MVGSTPTPITVQVTPETASAIRDASPGTEHPELQSLSRELGIAFHAMHPGTDDPTLRTYFTVDVQNAALAERVAQRLRDSPAIAAAYVKPPDAMP